MALLVLSLIEATRHLALLPAVWSVCVCVCVCICISIVVVSLPPVGFELDQAESWSVEQIVVIRQIYCVCVRWWTLEPKLGCTQAQPLR